MTKKQGFLYTMVKPYCSVGPKFTNNPEVAQHYQQDGWIVYCKIVGKKIFKTSTNINKNIKPETVVRGEIGYEGI